MVVLGKPVFFNSDLTHIIQKKYLSSKMITTRINYENCSITCICCLNNILVYNIEGHIL